MKKINNKAIQFILIMVGIVSILTILKESPAYALSIKLYDGATTVTCADGAVCDSNLAAGAVTFNGSVGSNWWLNVTTGITYPALGSTLSPQLDLHSVDLSSSAGGTLTISVSENDYAMLGTPLFSLVAGGTTSGTIDFNAYLDAGNTEFAATTPIGTLGTYGSSTTHSPEGFAGSISGSASVINPYSLTMEAKIVHGVAGATSFDASMNAVPEPSSLLLLGSGLLGIGFAGKRRWLSKSKKA